MRLCNQSAHELALNPGGLERSYVTTARAPRLVVQI
jgi:hypothetical protein